MRFLFLAPLPSAFGEALHGARLATALVDRGHVAYFAAPSAVAATVSDARVPFLPIDAALPRLDAEVEALVARHRCDVLVLVDVAAVDKVSRALAVSAERIASAAPHTVSIDCWNLVSPPPIWDYGAISEPLDPTLLDRTAVIRPVPISPIDAPGGYAALPAIAAPSSAQRIEARRRLGLPERASIIVWPMARWQLPTSQDQPDLARLAAQLPELLLPVFAALGDNVTIAHVSPEPLDSARRPPSYRHIAQLSPTQFEALVGAADVLLSFNAAASSLATAVSLGVPTALCVARLANCSPLWAWPLSLDGILASTIRNNPVYDTMSMLDPSRADELIAGLRALLFDVDVRDHRRAAQASYRDAVAKLPDGASRLLEQLGA
jgi:Family of unknown function (DUF6365)